MARPTLKKPTLLEVEYVAHTLARALWQFGEPIPPFHTRYPDKLESCLKTPFQTFQRKSLYPTFERKAAMLFYLMIKNHPFQNGNKRVAVVTLIYFLSSNGRKLTVDNLTLYEFAKKIAASEATQVNEVVNEIQRFVFRFTQKGAPDTLFDSLLGSSKNL